MHLFRISPFFKQCFVTAAVCCSIIGHGCNTGYPAVLLPQLQAPDSPISVSSEQSSWFTSILAIMMVIGNFISMWLMDVYGRKTTHVLMSIPAAAGWILTAAWPTGFTQIFVGKILISLSFGLSLPLRSVLIGEYTSPKFRGAFLTTVGLSHAIGIFLVHLVGSVIGWQLTAFLATIFPVFSLIMILFCPESPSFLASKGRFDECRESFHWLRGDTENEELEELINARSKLNEAEKLRSIGEIIEIIKKKEFYKPMISMTHAIALLQFSGAPSFAAYGNVLVKEITGDVNNVNFWMVEIDANRIVTSVIAIFIVYNLKRRLVTFVTGSICVVTHVAIALHVTFRQNGSTDQNNSWIGLLLLNIQFITVGLGMTTMPNIFLGEVFPLRFRSLGNAITNVVSSLCNFILLKTLSYLIETIFITGTYYLYAGLLTYFLIVLWFLVPETKDKTLQQIEDEYRGSCTTEKEEKNECSTRF